MQQIIEYPAETIKLDRELVESLTRSAALPTLRALVARGATHVAAPFPFGAEGTSAWIGAAAAAFGIGDDDVRRVTATAELRARSAIARHRERLDGTAKRLHPVRSLQELPDGAMIAAESRAFLILSGRPLLWSPAGYRRADLPKADGLLTPPSTLAVLRAGYRPDLHPTALAAP